MEKKILQIDNSGWISLHRKIVDNPIFDNPNGLKVWIWCLIKANRFENNVLLGRKLIHLKFGQFIFGSNTACEQLKMSKSTIHFWLNYLKVERQIERQTTNRYSIITVLNYIKYQIFERQIERQRNAKRTPKETNNNIDKENKVNKERERPLTLFEKTVFYLKAIPEEDKKYFVFNFKIGYKELFSKANNLIDYCEMHKKGYHDPKAFLRNAVRRDYGERKLLKVGQKKGLSDLIPD